MESDNDISRSAQVILRACVDKRSYSLKQADDFITEKMNEGIILYYYKCIFCGRYHLSKLDHTVYTIEIIGGKK